MMALVLKDLMTIKKQLQTHVLFVFIMFFMALFWNQGPTLFVFIIFFAVIQAITALTYDELCNWDKYANTLPIPKNVIVGSRYVLSIVLMVIGLTFALPLAFLINILSNNQTSDDFFLTFCLIIAAAFCILSLLLPIYIKYGSIKGRIVLVFAFFLPSLVISMFSEFFEKYIPTIIQYKSYGYFAPLVGLCILWISSVIATSIYVRKEF